MQAVHPLHPVVLILGVLFALRRMSVSQRLPDDHPGVAPQAFDRWKALARSAYGLGMSACFGKVLADYAVSYLVGRFPVPIVLVRGVGIGLEIAWVALFVLSYLRVRRAHKLAREIGVEPVPAK